MPQTLLDTDSWTGAAGTLLSSYSANWVKTDVAWNEADIAASGTGLSCSAISLYCGQHRTGQTWTDDHWAEFKLDTIELGTLLLVGVRVQAAGKISGYYAGYSTFDDATHYLLFKETDTTRVTLATSATTYVTGDTVNLEAVGTTLTVRVNGVVLSDLTTTDATYSTGNPGVLIYDGTSNATDLAGTWRAGSVTASAPTPSPLFRGS